MLQSLPLSMLAKLRRDKAEDLTVNEGFIQLRKMRKHRFQAVIHFQDDSEYSTPSSHLLAVVSALSKIRLWSTLASDTSRHVGKLEMASYVADYTLKKTYLDQVQSVTASEQVRKSYEQLIRACVNAKLGDLQTTADDKLMVRKFGELQYSDYPLIPPKDIAKLLHKLYSSDIKVAIDQVNSTLIKDFTNEAMQTNFWQNVLIQQRSINHCNAVNIQENRVTMHFSMIIDSSDWLQLKLFNGCDDIVTISKQGGQKAKQIKSTPPPYNPNQSQMSNRGRGRGAQRGGNRGGQRGGRGQGPKQQGRGKG